MLGFLYKQVSQKLKEKGIPEEAKTILLNIKIELAKMLNVELTLETLPEIEVKLEEFTKQLKELSDVRNQ